MDSEVAIAPSEINESLETHGKLGSEMVDSILGKLDPVHRDTKFFLQTIVYNEMPANESSKARANLPIYLLSLSNSYIRYKTNSTSKERAEVLMNINNQPNVSCQYNGETVSGTIENVRAIDFVNSIKGDETVDSLLQRFDWINKSNQVEFAFYRTVIEKCREAITKGLSLQIVDCVNGDYVSQVSKELPQKIDSATQGSRRWLLGRLALRRAFKTKHSRDAVFSYPDADVILHPNYFESVSQYYSQNSGTDPKIYALPYRVLSEKEAKGGFSDISNNLYFQDLEFVTKYFRDKQSGKKNLPRYIPPMSISGSFSTNINAYLKSGG